MAGGGGEQRVDPVPAVLFIRRPGAPFCDAMHQRFRVLELATRASTEQAAAFLAAAAAEPDPPRAAVVMGGRSVRADAAFLDAVPSVRCLLSTAAGVDHIDLAECARRGVAVANSGTVYSADVADHAVGMLVDVLRRVSAAERFVRRRLWPLQEGGYPLGSQVHSCCWLRDFLLCSLQESLEAFSYAKLNHIFPSKICCISFQYMKFPSESDAFDHFSLAASVSASSDWATLAL